MNGDGYEDLIVGAPDAEEGAEGQGISYVIFGKANGFSDIDLGIDLTAGNIGFKIRGKSEDDKSGYSVSSVGDVNGDGYDDLIIGAYFAGEGLYLREGNSYVIFGKSSGFSDIDLEDGLGRDVGFEILGESAY